MATITGRVVYDGARSATGGASLAGIAAVPIVLQNMLTAQRLAIATAANGDFSFINVPDGTYRLVESYGTTGTVASPGDFSAAIAGAIPSAAAPPLSAIPTPPLGATNLDFVSHSTYLITVTGSNLNGQYFYNGPIQYTPLNINLDTCAIIGAENLLTAADNGTFGSFAPGTALNTGPAIEPYPGSLPDFTYVVPNPSTYTPTDGEFTIQNTMTNAMSNTIGAWWRVSDHTSGDETGRMAIINENNPGSIFFRADVNVTPGREYLFSAWILNLFTTPGYAEPEFGARILDEYGGKIYSTHLGFEIPVQTAVPQWKEIGTVFNSRDNDTVTIEFFSEGIAAVGNDFALDDIAVRTIELPNFALTKRVSTPVAQLGDTLTFTLELTDTCSQPLTNISLFDSIQPGFTFAPGSVTVNSVPYPAANPNAGIALPDLPGGASHSVEFDAVVTEIPTDNPAKNTATLSYDYTPVQGGFANTYTLESNAVQVLIDEVPTLADVSITKCANRRCVNTGDALAYTLIVKNHGPDAARNVVLTDIIARAMRPMYTLDLETWREWTGELALGELEPGQSVTVRILCCVDGCAPAEICNTARVNSETPDPNTANNCAFLKTANAGCRAVNSR